MVQHDGAAAVVECLTHGMGNHHGGQFVVGDDLFRQFHHEGCGFGVECGGVFVQQQDFAGLQAGHQQADGLALAAGEQADAVCEAVFEAEFEQGEFFAEEFAVLAVQGETQPAFAAAGVGQCHVFFDAECFAGAGQRVLEDAGDEVGAFVGGQAGNVAAVDVYAAAVHHQVAADGVEEGGFARAVAADDGNEFAVSDVQAHAAHGRVFDGCAGVEGYFQVVGAHHGVGFLFRRRLTAGSCRANTTSTAVIRFRSVGRTPMLCSCSLPSAKAIIRR